MTLAVTGATGHLGRLAIDHLLARGTAPDEVVALVRRPDAAEDLAALGIAVRAFDYDESEALAAALEGVTSLLLVSATAVGKRAAQHHAVIAAAKTAGVGRVVYTSAPSADASINPVAPEHKTTEEALAASGVPFVILRNGWYHENYLPDLTTAAQTGEILTAAGDGRVASASRSDLAEAAAVVLAGGETDRTYTLGGDVAWSFDDLAGDFAAVLGRPVSVHRVSGEEKAAALASFGVDPGLAGFVVGVDAAIAAGELAIGTGDLSRLIGHPTSPIVDVLRQAV
jgi:NAD(P)H dehydrogenase (quinone)